MQEQVSLGRFEVHPDEEWKNRRDIVPEIWVETPLRGGAGDPQPGSTGFEAKHYHLTLTVPPRPDSEWTKEMDEIIEGVQKGKTPRYLYPRRGVEGEAKITVSADSAGRRFVRLRLHPDLKITRVYAQGQEPLWFRSRYNAYIVLPSAVEIPSWPGWRRCIDRCAICAGSPPRRAGGRTCRG